MGLDMFGLWTHMDFICFKAGPSDPEGLEINPLPSFFDLQARDGSGPTPMAHGTSTGGGPGGGPSLVGSAQFQVIGPEKGPQVSRDVL